MSVAMPYADFVFGNESEAVTYGETKVGNRRRSNGEDGACGGGDASVLFQGSR